MRPLLLALALLATTAARAQDGDRLAPFLDGLGTFSRPADTDDPLAQRYFDQGLVLSFAFNHAEAVRAFREAQRLDPACAMCAWGEALARGPHVNAAMTAEDAAPAWAALQRALALARDLPAASRALVDALGARYAPEPTDDRSALDRAYAAAMRVAAAGFPDDATIQALFAEALMDTMPWDYWNADGSPKPETEEVLAALTLALDAVPDHPLALHLWIHAVEKQRPELGVEAATRLGPLVPAAGHLVHMPGHIWIRVGRYHDAVVANQQAVLADDDYLAQCHAQGLYPTGYVPHNHHFLWVAALLGGERATALASADHMGHHADMMGMPGMAFLQHFAMSPLYARAAFEMWDEVLAAPAPPDSLVYPTGVWHFARGLALARTGRVAEAEEELAVLRPLATVETLGEKFGGLNTLGAILDIAVPYLAGEVAAARGEVDEAVRQLSEAVRLEDALIYDEPPPWALPSRWALGRVLLDAGRFADAEAVYRADLAVYPENGRGLAGLAAALRARGRAADADALRPRIDAAWQHADVPLDGAAPVPPPASPALRFGEARLPDGTRLHYAEQGDASGRPVLFLHGYTDSWASFGRVLPLLPSSVRAVALDLRGHGDSDRPAGGYAQADLAADVVAFMNAVGMEGATVVGHSMGSLVAQDVVRLAPERVEQLVLIGAGTSAREFDGAEAFVEAVAALADPVPTAFAREFQASTVVHAPPADFMDRMVGASLRLPARVWQAVLAGMLDAPAPTPLPVAVPTLLVWGEADAYVGRAAQDALLALHPQATLTAYPHTGHAPHWERPLEVARDLLAVLARPL